MPHLAGWQPCTAQPVALHSTARRSVHGIARWFTAQPAAPFTPPHPCSALPLPIPSALHVIVPQPSRHHSSTIHPQALATLLRKCADNEALERQRALLSSPGSNAAVAAVQCAWHRMNAEATMHVELRCTSQTDPHHPLLSPCTATHLVPNPHRPHPAKPPQRVPLDPTRRHISNSSAPP